MLSWFWGDNLGQEITNLHDLYIQYYCTVWYVHACITHACICMHVCMFAYLFVFPQHVSKPPSCKSSLYTTVDKACIFHLCTGKLWLEGWCWNQMCQLMDFLLKGLSGSQEMCILSLQKWVWPENKNEKQPMQKLSWKNFWKTDYMYMHSVLFWAFI